ncbi:MAG: biopolymer transporter ExbD, partial [Gammaproteobacteria bacterium]|nr:biopolymer transporter ExbD [Gammaproteobacteria bacterium]
LIFFIVTTSFVQESGIEVERPSATTAQRQDSANVLVAISARGDIWVGGRPVHLRALGAAVRTQLDRAPNAAVVIQSDRAAPVARLVEVMDQIRLVGVSNMAIATERASPR